MDRRDGSRCWRREIAARRRREVTEGELRAKSDSDVMYRGALQVASSFPTALWVLHVMCTEAESAPPFSTQRDSID